MCIKQSLLTKQGGITFFAFCFVVRLVVQAGPGARRSAYTMRLSNAEVWIKALGWLSAMLFIIVVDADSLGPDEACMDFRADGVQPSAWTLADCTEVWTQFVETIPLNQRRRENYADGWREITTVLRLAGSPCLCGSHGGGDGVGSMTMRIISSWIFSEEMGCDWVTPKWNRPHVNGENGTVLYCHRTAPIGELNDPTISKVAIEENNHCSVVDWLAYFQFNLPSVDLPEGENIKSIEVTQLVDTRCQLVALRSIKHPDYFSVLNLTPQRGQHYI